MRSELFEHKVFVLFYKREEPYIWMSVGDGE